MHAFYSKIQEDLMINRRLINNSGKKIIRHNIYLHEDGHEVITTEVTSNLENSQHSKNFKDSHYLGKVTKWIKTVYSQPC